MKQHVGNAGTNYHFLFLKQYIAKIKQNQTQLRKLIVNNLPEDIALDLEKEKLGTQKQNLNILFDTIKDEPWVRKIIEEMAQKISLRSSQRTYFLVQNFRQACSAPIATSKPEDCYNLLSIFKTNINKELRRVIWLKCLMLQTTKFQFFQHDHKIMPYNLTQELSVHLIRITSEFGIKLKENQKDCCVRLLEYVVKKWDRIPNSSQQHLAMTIVDVFAHYTPARIQEIGSVYVGLMQLSNVYFQQDVNQRLRFINLAFELVDPQTFQIIQQCYLPNSQKDQALLNECFEHFRLTLTSAFFPLPAAQFVIDQLLIKKRNKFDMYILFAMMAMIMSDDLQKYKGAKMQLTDVINAQNTKKTIKLQDVVDAFKVIYQNIHPYHLQNSNQGPQVNKLLDHLIIFDNQDDGNKKRLKQKLQTSLKLIEPTDKMQGFVVEEKNEVLRLGTKIQKK